MDPSIQNVSPEQGPHLRALLVEDEMMVAMHLEDMLTDLGHEVVGYATRIEKAMALAQTNDIDLAILDVNVAGKKSFPVADILRQRGVPFVFATGYGTEGLAEGYRDAPTLQKPFSPQDLQRAIGLALLT